MCRSVDKAFAFLFTLLIVVSSLGSTIVPAAAAESHHLRFSNGDNIITLNPALSAETTVGLLSQLTMAYLIRYDKHNRPIPELATVIPTESNGGISPDGLTIMWHLRGDARWSDGVPFDSSDVAFSVAIMQNASNNVVSHDGFSLISSVDTPNKMTAVFRLKSRYAAFMPRFFGSPPGNPAILPKHILAGMPDINHAPYNSLPIGIGPFRYVAWNRDDSIEMEANPNYFRGEPHLKKVSFKIVRDANTELAQLQAGELDLVVGVKPGDIARAQGITQAKVLLNSGYRFVVLAFNTQHPATSDLFVRKALELAVDRHALLDKVNHRIGALQESFVPEQYSQYHALPLAHYSLSEANFRLDKDGWARGPDGVRTKNGKRLTIDLNTVTGAYAVEVELLRGWWSQIGVELNTKTFAPIVFYQPATGVVFGGQFDATIYSIQNFPFVYPSLIFGCNRIPPGGLNIPRFCNPHLDSIMASYESTYDEAKQRDALYSITEIVRQDTPVVVLDFPKNAFVERDSIQGFTPNAITFFDNMLTVDIK